MKKQKVESLSYFLGVKAELIYRWRREFSEKKQEVFQDMANPSKHQKKPK